MRNTDISAFDLTSCFVKLCGAKIGLCHTLAYTRTFHTSVRPFDICCTRPRETYRGQFTKRSSDVSIGILCRGDEPSRTRLLARLRRRC